MTSAGRSMLGSTKPLQSAPGDFKLPCARWRFHAANET